MQKSLDATALGTFPNLQRLEGMQLRFLFNNATPQLLSALRGLLAVPSTGHCMRLHVGESMCRPHSACSLAVSSRKLDVAVSEGPLPIQRCTTHLLAAAPQLEVLCTHSWRYVSVSDVPIMLLPLRGAAHLRILWFGYTIVEKDPDNYEAVLGAIESCLTQSAGPSRGTTSPPCPSLWGICVGDHMNDACPPQLQRVVEPTGANA